MKTRRVFLVLTVVLVIVADWVTGGLGHAVTWAGGVIGGVLIGQLWRQP